MISGLYLTTLENLAAPAKLEMSNEAYGIKYYMRYKHSAISFTISIEELNHVARDEVKVLLIENKIKEARDALIKACCESI